MLKSKSGGVNAPPLIIFVINHSSQERYHEINPKLDP